MGFFSDDGAAQLGQAKTGSAADVEAAKKYNPFGNFLTGLSKVGSKAYTNTDKNLDAKAMDPFQARAAALSSGQEFRDQRQQFVSDVQANERLDQVQKTKVIADYDAQEANVNKQDAITGDRLQGAAREGIGKFNNKQAYGQSVYDSYIDAGMTGVQASAAQKAAETEFFDTNNAGAFSGEMQAIGQIDFNDPVAVQKALGKVNTMTNISPEQQASLRNQITAQAAAFKEKRNQNLTQDVVGLKPLDNYKTQEQYLDAINQLGVGAGKSQAELNEMRAAGVAKWNAVSTDAVNNYTNQMLAQGQKDGTLPSDLLEEFRQKLTQTNLSPEKQKEAIAAFETKYANQLTGALSKAELATYNTENTRETKNINDAYDARIASMRGQFADQNGINPQVMELDKTSAYTSEDNKALSEIYGGYDEANKAIQEIRDVASTYDIALSDNEIRNLAAAVYDSEFIGPNVDSSKLKEMVGQLAAVKQQPEAYNSVLKTLSNLEEERDARLTSNAAKNLQGAIGGSYKASSLGLDKILEGTLTKQDFIDKLLDNKDNQALQETLKLIDSGYEGSLSNKQKVAAFKEEMEKRRKEAEIRDQNMRDNYGNIPFLR